VIECDGTEWFVIGGSEPELIYWHEELFNQTNPVQNQLYKVTNFELALPTGGTWEIEYGVVLWVNDIARAVMIGELTCSIAAATEDDEKYTIRRVIIYATNDSPESFTVKAFRRTFASATTLHINAVAKSAGAENLYVDGGNGSNYLRARRIR